MMGTCANESVPWIYGILNEPSPMETCDGFILFVFGLETGMKVLDFYGDPPAGEEKDARPFLSEGTTDYIFYCSTRFVLDAVSSHVPTFMYIFDYVPSFQEWIYGPGSVCDDLVCHCREAQRNKRNPQKDIVVVVDRGRRSIFRDLYPSLPCHSFPTRCGTGGAGQI